MNTNVKDGMFCNVEMAYLKITCLCVSEPKVEVINITKCLSLVILLIIFVPCMNCTQK